MNNSAAKVGEIFREAGTAFNKLSEMTMLLHPMGDDQPGGKWTDEEIEMLRGCVHRFAVDLNKLSQHIKTRTVSQIRTTLKKKAFEDAGIPVRQTILAERANCARQLAEILSRRRVNVAILQEARWKDSPFHPVIPVYWAHDFKLFKDLSSDILKVTLNMLNASENEVDVEGLSGEVKLEFEAANEEDYRIREE